MDENSNKLCRALLSLFIRFYGIIFMVYAFTSGTYFIEDFFRYNSRITYSGSYFTPHLLWLFLRFLINAFFGIALFINTRKWVQLTAKGILPAEKTDAVGPDTKEH